MTGKFRIDFCNIRGLRSNFFALYAHTQCYRPDIVSVCETQVCETADPLEFSIPGYNFVPAFASNRGLALYARKSLIYEVQAHLNNNDPEFTTLWLKLKVRSVTIHTCFLYRSPNIDKSKTFNSFDALSNIISRIIHDYPNTEIIITGDFNIHNIPWLKHSSHTSLEGQYVELFAAHNHLSQLVKEPTHIPNVIGSNGNMLDLFLSSHPEKYNINVIDPIGNSDHCVLSANFSYTDLNETPDRLPSRLVFLFKEANWSALSEFFNNFNWKICFLDRNINSAAEMVVNIILLGMKMFIPRKTIFTRIKDKCWFNSICRDAVKAKNKAFRDWRLNKNNITDLHRKQTRRDCDKILSRERLNFERNVRLKILDTPKNSKSFWSFVKRIRNSSGSSIPPLQKNDRVITEPREKADLFANLFSSNSSLPETDLPPPILPCVTCTMPNVFFRTRAVKKVLSELNVNKSPGPDCIPPIVLKKCSSSLARPLRNLFYMSYQSGVFPNCWKIANVQPIPKKGDPSNPDNYRPIALCSTLSKVMESMLNHHLVSYIETNHLLNDKQYGFRNGRSTGDLMAFLSEQWSRSIHRMGESKVVSLDISKAFDRVWHKSLLSKLTSFGVGVVFTKFISSFLSDRIIRVVIDGVTSKDFILNSGVPQGSVLSPTLFLIFMNDLLEITSNPIYSFADDSNISHTYSFDRRPLPSEVNSSRLRMNESLNRDLNIICAWGKSNMVDFNALKTQCCLLTHKPLFNLPSSNLQMGNSTIVQEDSLSILGIKIQSDVRWNQHVFDLAKESFKCLGFLRRCKAYFSPPDLLRIYTTYIRPKMEYNSHIWAGVARSSLEMLDRVQKRAIDLIGDNAICESLNTLEHRRNVGCLSLLYRYYHGKCSDDIRSLIPNARIFIRNTRLANNAHPFVINWTTSRTTHYRENSFFGRTIRMWNALPAYVFPIEYSVQQFKSNVHKHYFLFPPTYHIIS